MGRRRLLRGGPRCAVLLRLPGMLARTVAPTLVDRLPRLRGRDRVARLLSIPDPDRRYAAWLMHFTP